MGVWSACAKADGRVGRREHLKTSYTWEEEEGSHHDSRVRASLSNQHVGQLCGRWKLWHKTKRNILHEHSTYVYKPFQISEADKCYYPIFPDKKTKVQLIDLHLYS